MLTFQFEYNSEDIFNSVQKCAETKTEAIALFNDYCRENGFEMPDDYGMEIVFCQEDADQYGRAYKKADRYAPHRILCIDMGKLLEKDDPEFEAYSQVYNKEYGYYDENQVAFLDKDAPDMVKKTIAYVKNGCDGTYAVISDERILCDNPESFDDGDVEGFTYDKEDVVFSVAKIDGKICYNFV